MPAAAPRKPSNAQTSFALSKGQKQFGIFVLILGVIIGLSAVFSPSEEGAAPAAKAIASAVISLNDETLDKFLAQHPEGVLVDFSSSQCKFCLKLAPEFDKAAKELKAGGPPLVVIDSESGAQAVQKYGITRFPTVVWMWNGQNVLELARASEKPAQKIVEWARWAAGPAVQELETYEEFAEGMPTLRSTLHSKARLLVAFNRPDSGAFKEAFVAAAQRHRATTIFLYLKDITGAPDGPMIKSYGSSESEDEDYQGSADSEEVLQWVKAILDKARPKEAEQSKVEDAKPAATKAMEQVQKALQNAESAGSESEEA
jgi:thioredoxin-like negative regulator of GroEL